MNRTIGIDVAQPKETCTDAKCPFHGALRVRGRTFRGTVLSTKMHNSASISWNRMQKNPKYERYLQKWTKIHAHNPPCINAQKGDIVTIIETRPISKTKSFVIVERVGTDIDAQIKEESKELDRSVKIEKDEKRRERKEADAKDKTNDKEEAQTPRVPVKEEVEVESEVEAESQTSSDKEEVKQEEKKKTPQ